ncbi:peptidase inhibitor family I36 protein [Actinoplanes sp. NPDC051494]|uniref:peptidase inhibitor family I36 protein n=1 Tax=Actinoplanes sp. NPDC051494 TaxID=3363907 RepID=UPI0037A611AC
MRTPRRIAVFLSALAVASASSAVVASSAQAAAACYAGELCVYQHSNYTGSVFKVPADSRGWLCDMDLRNNTFYNGEPMDNKASSIKNNTGKAVDLYLDPATNGIDIDYIISWQQSVPNMATVVPSGSFAGGNLDNQLSGIC